ncbi:MAG: hypothetical protein ACO2PN_13810 [Pyrobaculum sp.]|jgi:hypothetical protein
MAGSKGAAPAGTVVFLAGFRFGNWFGEVVKCLVGYLGARFGRLQ